MAMSNYTGLIYYAFYDRNKIENEWELYVGSSGGGGHIAAIEGLRLNKLKAFAEGQVKLARPTLPTYVPVNHAKKPWLNMQKQQIELGLSLPQTIKEALTYLKLPILPNAKDIRDEIAKLANANVKERFYIDVLLDVYPTGYENVAIWNVLQKQDKTEELKTLIEWQEHSDALNYKYVYGYFTNLLEKAARENLPYTKIVSSQAMALPALCDAVIHYNSKIAKKYGALPIKIHQFLTDLPSPGAVHFLKPLERLTPAQRNCMVVYGINITKVKEFNLLSFAKMVDIDPANNPMVRQGFYMPSLQDYLDLKDVVLSVQVKDKEDEHIPISAQEKVAAIMLGSQASVDTIKYVNELEKSELYNKIFVFGGKMAHIYNELAQTEGFKKGKIILLDNQDDKYIAPIMTRSNLAIIRGGGLSVMEQEALRHRKNKLVLVHCQYTSSGLLTSGISWEDCNVDNLEEELEKKNVVVRRTTPELINLQLQQLFENDAVILEKDIEISSRLFLRSKIIDLQNKLKTYFSSKHGYSHSLAQSKNSIAITLLSKLNLYVLSLNEASCDLTDLSMSLAFLLLEYQQLNKKAYESTLFLKWINDKGSLGTLLSEYLTLVERFCPIDYKNSRQPEVQPESEVKRLTYQ